MDSLQQALPVNYGFALRSKCPVLPAPSWVAGCGLLPFARSQRETSLRDLRAWPGAQAKVSPDLL